MSELDRLLPRWDFAETHRIDLAVPRADAVTAAESVTWADVPLFRAALTVASLGRFRAAGDRTLVATMTAGSGFRVLARTPDELIVGAVTRMGDTPGPVDLGTDPGTTFRDFAAPGHYRVAVGFAGTGAQLITTTRVAVADEASRRRFPRYWYAIRLPGGLIRREWLRGARRRAAA